jgi:hypothetical protein
MPRIRSRIGQAAGVIAVAAAALLPGTAFAAGTGHTAHPTAIRAAFAAQDKRAGLTSSQATQLQAEVNHYVAKTGGTQVGANKIAVRGGVMVVAVPGEKYARDLSKPGAATSFFCNTGHFCAYSDTVYSGTVMDLFFCKTYAMPWNTVGSFQDHQFSGTVSVFTLVNGRKTFTVTAVTDDPNIDWLQILNIKIC